MITNSVANAIQYFKLRRLEAENLAEMFKLMLNAFAHRGRNMLTSVKDEFKKTRKSIQELEDTNNTKENLCELFEDAESSIKNLNELYSQYENWFGSGDKKESVLITKLFSEALDQFKNNSQVSKKRVKFNLSRSEAASVYVRKSIVAYVFNELLLNSKKNGASEVSAYLKNQNDDIVELIIEDDGKGLSDEMINAFKQGKLMRRENMTEGGLGLLLSRRFIEAENGTFELIESAKNGKPGVCFKITLPVKTTSIDNYGEIDRV